MLCLYGEVSFCIILARERNRTGWLRSFIYSNWSLIFWFWFFSFWIFALFLYVWRLACVFWSNVYDISTLKLSLTLHRPIWKVKCMSNLTQTTLQPKCTVPLRLGQKSTSKIKFFKVKSTLKPPLVGKRWMNCTFLRKIQQIWWQFITFALRKS